VTSQQKVYIFDSYLIQQFALFLCSTIWLLNYNEVESGKY